jgi:hypothetical protein
MRIITTLLLVLLLASCTVTPREEQAIKNMGYDIGDVEVFLTSIGSDGYAFLKSPSLRKQYERFRDGEVTPFIAQAKAKEDADRQRTSGLATGLATGLAIGSGMSSNSN